MKQEISPIPVRPWTLNGISERLIVSHYENNSGAAVRTLNAVRSELAALEAGTPGHRLRALKREELIALGSVMLHEPTSGTWAGKATRPRARGALRKRRSVSGDHSRSGSSRRAVPTRGGPRHDLVIRGLLAAQTDDHQVVAHGLARFAGLRAGVHRKE
jgi:hypothetical protein